MSAGAARAESEATSAQAAIATAAADCGQAQPRHENIENVPLIPDVRGALRTSRGYGMFVHMTRAVLDNDQDNSRDAALACRKTMTEDRHGAAFEVGFRHSSLRDRIGTYPLAASTAPVLAQRSRLSPRSRSTTRRPGVDTSPLSTSSKKSSSLPAASQASRRSLRRNSPRPIRSISSAAPVATASCAKAPPARLDHGLTRKAGFEYLRDFMTHGSPAGMPNWGTSATCRRRKST